MVRLEFPSTYFVFGSNTGGYHGRGAAQYAKKYLGAEQGVGEGLTGECYALPTVEYVDGEGLSKMSIDRIEEHIHNFLSFAKNRSELNFQLTKVGCGLAGYDESEIFPLFQKHGIPDNVWLPYDWNKISQSGVALDHVIVAGGRYFTDYGLMKESLNNLIVNPKNTVIVSGFAAGADTLGERYAEEHDIDVIVMKPEWKRYPNHRSGGFIRNEKMAWFSNRLVAFWDGQSTGTKHMIDTSKKYNIYSDVVMYERR